MSGALVINEISALQEGQAVTLTLSADLSNQLVWPIKLRRIVVSSAQRTRETWARMAPAFSTAAKVAYEDGLYQAKADAIVSVIKATGGNAAVLMVIGHNPGMHDAARLLLAHRGGRAHQLDDGLPTAGLVVIDFAEDDWQRMAARSGRLKGLVTPRLLRLAKDNE